MLRQMKKPVFYVVNKVDGEKVEALSAEFYELGIDSFHTVSAAHNHGIGDLMDDVIAAFPKDSITVEDDDLTRIAVVGRPNVGKSSLVNRLLGFERSVANPVAGTTRDSIDTFFTCNKKRYLLIDTAGIRRKGKVSLKIETYSVVDALRSIEKADVVLIVINAEEGVTEQDTKIAGYAYEAGKSCLFVVNKWDAVEKNNASIGKFVDKIRMEFKYLAFAPIVFVSALSGQRTGKIIAEVDALMEQYSRRVSTADLNHVFKEAVESHHAPLSSGRRVKFYYATQVAVKPPTFVIFTNQPEGIHFSYERYLSNKIREAFGFTGITIKLMFRGREKAKNDERALS